MYRLHSRRDVMTARMRALSFLHVGWQTSITIPSDLDARFVETVDDTAADDQGKS
jgi:hypothetical protein